MFLDGVGAVALVAVRFTLIPFEIPLVTELGVSAGIAWVAETGLRFWSSALGCKSAGGVSSKADLYKSNVSLRLMRFW